MAERPEDSFKSESDISSSPSEELTGLRLRLASLQETRANTKYPPVPLLAAMGVVVVAGLIGVASWAWNGDAPQQAATPAAANSSSQAPADPANPAAATTPATGSKPASLAGASKPSNRRRGTPAALPTGPTSGTLSLAPAVDLPYVATTADRRGVEAVVDRYQDSVTKMDATAVRAVWPSADARDLAREFGQLQEQQVEIQSCDFDIKETTAAATCTGFAGYVPKVGNGRYRFDDRRWLFTLKRAGTGWTIQNVVVR